MYQNEASTKICSSVMLSIDTEPLLFQVARYLYEGYSSIIKLSHLELSLLYDIVVARFTLSISLGNETQLSGRASEYVAKCVQDNINFLRKLTDIGRETFNRDVFGI